MNKAELSELALETYGVVNSARKELSKLGQLVEDLTETKADLTQQIEESNGANITSADIKDAIKCILPEVVKETVTQALKEKSITKSYVDALKNTQTAVVQKATESFDNTLEKALVRNQKEIIQSTTARADVEDYERRNRVRNIVITGIPESESNEPKERQSYDVEKIIALQFGDCELRKEDIEHCYRAGRKREPDSGTTDRPRPLVVILKSPKIAQNLHKYGVGRKVDHGLWVNPDLTKSEREAAYKARQSRRNNKLNHVANTNEAETGFQVDDE